MKIDEQGLSIVVKGNFDDFNDKVIYSTKLMNAFKRSCKMSIWQLIKMKIAKVFFPKSKITIEELIEKERNK